MVVCNPILPVYECTRVYHLCAMCYPGNDHTWPYTMYRAVLACGIGVTVHVVQWLHTHT